MKFILKLTNGGEVVFDGPPSPFEPVYYGGPPPETGRWHVDLIRFEDFCATHLGKIGFGDSIDTFYFGLEIAELQGWGDRFATTKEYVSYRPKMKALVSVGQIEWSEVKHLELQEQMDVLWATLLTAVERVASMKRKPKSFDSDALSTAVRVLRASCDPSTFAIKNG
ncbi:MAG TPA: hypothetical protein VIN03_13880 [Roseateles sp.]